jgi:flagellar biosynthesis anti-sigma factor FlgM
MKIDGNRPNLDQAALHRLERAAADTAKPAANSKASSSVDTVQVSTDATLAHDAVKLANAAPEIRADLVERMRALLAAGELGADAGQLADSLIASITEKPGSVDK